MATKTDLLADPDLDAMVGDLARELGCPYDVSPDHVRPGPIPPEAMGFNAGMVRSGEVLYREGQRWRARALRELAARPEWVREWKAAVALDARIEALCAERGYRFAPHEVTPWQVSDDGPCPWQGTIGATSWPAAQALRRRLIAELRRDDHGPAAAD
jgi:hypothetical protein